MMVSARAGLLFGESTNWPLPDGATGKTSLRETVKRLLWMSQYFWPGGGFNGCLAGPSCFGVHTVLIHRRAAKPPKFKFRRDPEMVKPGIEKLSEGTILAGHGYGLVTAENGEEGEKAGP